MVIAITGIGIVSPLGIGQKENRSRLIDGRSAVSQPRYLATSHKEWPIGEVRYSNGELAEILKLGDMEYSRNILLGLLALHEALDDAGLTSEMKKEIPIVNGSTVGGMDLIEEHYAEWIEGRVETLHLINQHEVDYTTNELVRLCGLKYGVTVSTACSSALNAIIHGAGLLRNGDAHRVIVGGTEAMTRFHLNGFSSLGILSNTTCRPFQDDRDGINLGEGAAFLVLENAESALERGAKIYGYLAGYGNKCDAYHQTASSPDGDGAFAAMTEALEMACVSSQQIDYINAHGTATPNNDASELRAFERVFQHGIPHFESTKSLTGHTTSASGSIEAIFSLFRMEENNYNNVISNAFGFGGNDSSIVISREPKDLPSAEADMEICCSQLHISGGELEYKPYISSMQSRRMTAMVRQLIVVAREALADAGIDCPDGIVVGTRFGGMIPTLQLLDNLVANGECDFSPALFMNSTHNSAAGTLARYLCCKGYNNTVVSAEDAFITACNDAKLALQSFSGIRNILVCSYEEIGPKWSSLLDRRGICITSGVKAQVFWVGK